MTAPARPAVQPARPWAFPVPRRTVVDNGMTVLGYDIPGQHVLSVRLAVPAPLAGEPHGREGVGALMARTLDEGTRRHGAQELLELVERNGVALSAAVGERGLVVSMDVPRPRLGPALDLLQEVLTEADFPHAEVARHVRARLAEIEQERSVPSQRAHLEFLTTFYDPTDRLAVPTGGTSDSLAALGRDQLLHYHAEIVRPEAATLTVAGHLAGLDIAQLTASALSGWAPAAGQSQEPAVPDQVSQLDHAPLPPRWGRRADDFERVVLVDRPGSVQSELYIGCLGPDRGADGGWAPYPVLGFILGGGPQARLDAVLREEKGFTYGIRCMFRPRAVDGVFVTSGSVRAEVTGEALALVLGILDDARDGVDPQESQAGIDFVSKTAPSRYATADAVADEAATRALEGSTTEETTQTLQAMAALTPDQLTEAYRRYVDGRWTIVVVGDGQSCLPQLRAGLPSGLADTVSVVPA
ncbi:MAG TPA: pitrilysin family protein [Dermatophilaceae bacterium]|nr:pitrilysin family protein [Dermatophilaceae bacterium]